MPDAHPAHGRHTSHDAPGEITRAVLALPGLARRLAGSPVRAADLRCGTGDFAIALARTWPALSIDGFDPDARAIARARERARRARLGRRVRFYLHDAGDESLSADYDVVTLLRPPRDAESRARLLAAARRLPGPGGCAIVAEPLARYDVAQAAPGPATVLLTHPRFRLLLLELGERPATGGTGTQPGR